ncbi:hypothetical protein FB45DRAFT_670540, partial [Roridomyces roridus]
PFGGMNLITCGDPCQLGPPRGKDLFNHRFTQCFTDESILNDQNTHTRSNCRGMLAWRQIDKVVVLDEIMRQKDDPILKDILGRLRMGTCTDADKGILDSYVLG